MSHPHMEMVMCTKYPIKMATVRNESFIKHN